MAKLVCEAQGTGLSPQAVEVIRAELRALADKVPAHVKMMYVQCRHYGSGNLEHNAHDKDDSRLEHAHAFNMWPPPLLPSAAHCETCT